MVCFRFIFILVSVLKLSEEVKVDVIGSLSMGKEVVSVLKSFVDKKGLNGRRFLGDEGAASEPDAEKDTISLIVYSSFLCRNVNFCKGDTGSLLNQYIITLTKAIENIFEALIDDFGKNLTQNSVKPIIFEGELRRLIHEINKMLSHANEKINEKNESYTWVDLLKHINAKFQDTAITYAAQRLEGKAHEINNFKNKLMQKIIITTTIIELNFEEKLCNKHKICTKSHAVTEALNKLLVEIIKSTDDQAKEFIRLFYEALPNTNFYYRISDVTGQEFQTILVDMAYSDHIAIKKVLGIVQKIVEERLNYLNNKVQTDKPNGRDVKLIHAMLSDMDHFYSKHQKEPFHEFLNDFFKWMNSGGKFVSQLRRMMKDLQNSLSFEDDELVYKLMNEMRVFMEITVDPAS